MILVTGVTGFVGGALLSELVADCSQVKALVRKVSTYLPFEIEQVVVDSMPSCLRSMRSDRYFLSYKLVDKGRFTNIWSSNYSYKTGLEAHNIGSFSRRASAQACSALFMLFALFSTCMFSLVREHCTEKTELWSFPLVSIKSYCGRSEPLFCKASCN